ncbi:MAG: MoaD/ThiS family protein [Geitlerinemataceae cyanobacterium]
MTSPSISVSVKFFAAYQDAYGVPEAIWSFASGACVADVLDRCLGEHPQLEPLRHRTRFGIDLEFVEGTTPLADGNEVVLIPPVSGG